MANIAIRSFTSGEITPSLYARTDLSKYITSLKTCRNFIIQRHGGAINRPGTGFVCEVKDSSKKVKLVPFVFNAEQTYILEFGNQYMRVIRNNILLTETAKNITGATQANPCVITITAHGYSNGNEVTISSVGGMTELNNRNFKVANVAANTFSLQYMDGTNVNSTSFGAYTSGGTAAKVYEIATSYVEADLPELQAYNQSADVIILVHLLYPPKELKRLGHTSWTISDMTFGASISAPTGISVASGGAGSKTFKYVVTATGPETGEESLPSSVGQITNAADPTASAPHTISWTNISGVIEYDIYKEQDGLYDWIGIAGESPFKDVGYVADSDYNPPEDRQPFTGAGNYPSTSAFHQQRLLFANTNNNPEGVWTSKTALRKNFMISRPLRDDDAVTFSLIGGQVNAIRHMLNLGKLIVFTSSGEWVIEGDVAGILIPGEINPRQHTYNGSGLLPPIVAGGNALYVQARNSTVRDLGYDFQTDSYRGNELSIFSSHLFDGYSLVNWSYQQIPHSIVWLVRDDGVLLSMTYLREHQIFGWSRHDFDGDVEDVKTIPEGSEDVPYFVIKREINGRTVRYIEYMHSRLIKNILDAVFVDSSLSYDGRNTGATTMTLSGGTNWTYDELLTLTASASYFTASDVGNQIVIDGSDTIRCIIKAYTSGTVVTVSPFKTVPVDMRNAAITNWSKAVDVVSGAWHLEGKDVSILADGFVFANPNNESYIVKTVTNGSVTLDSPASVIHVGLPIISDIETLNIDTQGDISSIADRKKDVNRLNMFIESSRGIWAGPDADNLTELKIRGVENEDYDEPIVLKTGVVDINIKPEWKSSGSIFIRQIDPLPLSILAIIPTGYMG